MFLTVRVTHCVAEAATLPRVSNDEGSVEDLGLLVTTGLDACDRAVEMAFAGAKASCAFDLCPGDPLAGAPCP
jgi:hypothetical protein